MDSHFELTDSVFEHQFASAQLDAFLFTHVAHLRLAYIHIKNYGLEPAIANISHQLYRYVITLGAEEKFNKTLTVAAIKAVYHFMQRSETDNFSEFILEFPRLKNNFKELMAAHYEVDIYNSPFAKKMFLEPDLLPFN